jgi:hypothetical protein
MSAILIGDWTEQEVQAEIADATRRVLGGYTRRQRTIVERFLDPASDRTLAQVAKEVRCSLTTVEDAVDQFMENLRALLDSLQAHPDQLP